MKQKLSILFILALALSISLPALAIDRTDRPDRDLPEVDGIYAVPDKPGMRMRVFVHNARPETFSARSRRPGPFPQPSYACFNSTVADPASESVVSGAGWEMPADWTYRLNPGSVPSTVGGANLANISANAFAAWQGTIGTKVNISRGADTTKSKASLDGQNIISWGTTSGSALAVSYVWYYQATGQLVEVDTIMNNKFTWYWSDPAAWSTGQTCAYTGVYDAQDILTHELGHTAGLDDEYDTSYQHNTMYGYGSTGETKKDTLTAGDMAGLNLLY